MDSVLQEKLNHCLRHAARQSGDPLLVRELAALADPLRGLEHAGFLEFARWLATAGDITPGSARAGELVGLTDMLSDPWPESGQGRIAAVRKLLDLRWGLQPPRLALFTQIANIPGGIRFLVELRARLLTTIAEQPELPELQLVDADLLGLFRSWFNYGFLRLVPIDWHRTPAAQLEKLMAFETVHPMADWTDLRRRLEKDRLCYAFFHPNMPDEPLIFVEIALTRTIATSIDGIFDPDKRLESTRDATTAIFYSINATQPGLAGVSLGNSLIKTVVEDLKRRYPQLRRFSSLSPMPGFRERYLFPILRRAGSSRNFILTGEQLTDFFDPADRELIIRGTNAPDVIEALAIRLADDQWVDDRAIRFALKPGLLRAAHHYLSQEKRRGGPLDPVAGFHLKNGAVLYNINFLSNTSAKGMAESWGLTVNYHYDLNRIEANQHEALEGRCVVSPQLERMLQLGASG
ncbi:MAG: malonyl-CoA decarboxylase family protein [Phycisphaeraceae bacterium]|nr:malonyl-CoA decarboxylase family protein [Phycisphaeraceae bacterium]